MMAFRLGLLWGKDPDELLASMTRRKLAEWMAYYNLCPFGHDWTLSLLAQVVAVVANANRGKNDSPIDHRDLLGIEKPPPSPEQIAFTFDRAIALADGSHR